MALSNLQQVLAVVRLSLKSYNRKNIAKIIMNFQLSTRDEAYVIVSTVSYGFVLTVHDILLFTFYTFQCSFSTILKHSQCGCFQRVIMLFHEFINLTYNYNNLISFLCAKKVLRDRIICPRCNKEIQLKPHELLVHCTNKYYKEIHGRKRKRQTCNFKLSALTGTWFARAHLDLVKICRLICYFLMLNSPRQALIQSEVQISSNIAVDWVNFCRELLNQWLTDFIKPLGGPNIIVEIDEAKFGRRKYHRGRLITGQWLFGGVERQSGKLFVVPVLNRTSATLIPLIRRYIAPGSIIHSDSWRAYNALCEENYIHRTVNHSQNFVDSITGVHTQNIERLWRDIRNGIPRFGTREYHYSHYLAEFIFKQQYNYIDRIDKFFDIMSHFYPLDNVNRE